MAKTAPAIPPPRLAESGGGDPSAIADNPRPAVRGKGEPEKVEREPESASSGSEDPKVKRVEELLDVEHECRGGGGRARPAGSGDLSGGRLPPYDVGGGLGLSRAENGGGAGEGDLPRAGAALDDGPSTR